MSYIQELKLKVKDFSASLSGDNSDDDYAYSGSRRTIFKQAFYEKIIDQRYVFSLEWHCNGASDAVTTKRSLYDSGALSAVLVGGEGKSVLVGAPAQSIRHVEAKSAAAIVSSKYNNALVAAQLPSGQWWLLAVVDGQPLSGMDVVGDYDSLRERAAELIRDFPGFELVGEVEFWGGDLAGKSLDRVQSLGIDQLLEHDAEDDSYRLKRLRGNAKRTVMFSAPLCALVFAVFVGWDFISEVVAMPFKQQELDEMRESWERQNKVEVASVIEKYNDLASTKPLNRWIVNMGRTLDGLPLEAGGWDLSVMDCGAGLSYCTIEWKNSGVGTFESLRSRVAILGSLDLKSSTVVKQSIKIKGYRQSQSGGSDVRRELNDLPSANDFNYHHISIIQSIGSIDGVTYSVKRSKKSPIVNAPPHEIAVDYEWDYPLFMYGPWELRGEGVDVLIGSMNMLDGSVFFGYNLKIEFSRSLGEVSANWTVGGYYMSRSEA